MCQVETDIRADLWLTERHCFRKDTENKFNAEFSGGLGVACWPLVPKFAGSNPAEAFGFLRAKNSSERLPSEGK